MRRFMCVGILVIFPLTTWAADEPLPKQPPEGWREFVPATKAFGVWLPNSGRRSERTLDLASRGLKFRVAIVQVEMNDKATLRAGQISLPLKRGERVDPNEAIEVFRDTFVKEFSGEIKDQSDIKLGKMQGKEYIIDTTNGTRAKLRLYANWNPLGALPKAPRIYYVTMLGTVAQIDGATGKMFFDSYKHQGMVKDAEKKKDKETTEKKSE